jgi:hypothetical protein
MRIIVYIVSVFRRRNRDTPKERRSVKWRRAERELFFWTVREVFALGRQALRLLLLTAVVLYAIVFLIEGRLPDLESIIRSL